MRRILTVGALLPLVAALASGCAVLAPGTGASGGDATLGDAIASANASDTTKVKRLDTGQSTPVAAGVEVDVAPGYDEPAAEEPLPRFHPPGRRIRPLFGAVGTMGFFASSDQTGFTGGGLTVGAYQTGRLRWDVVLLANDATFASNAPANRALRNAIDLEADLTGRWYLTHAHTVSGVYALAGLGTGTLFWDYANPVPVVRDGGTITVTDDRLNHFEAFGGVGVGLLQTRHVRLGLNAVSGVRVYGWHTYQGFENDRLPATSFARVLFELDAGP
jgi:hypothetical protein